MARYIVVRVESASTAETLLERFAVVPAIKVVGLFASPTSFCEGCDSEGKSTRSKKWGLWFCPICKKPKGSIMQHPRNLLQDEDLPPQFADMHISVWEPFDNPDPSKKYGAEVIERKKAQINNSSDRVNRRKRRSRRRKEAANG